MCRNLRHNSRTNSTNNIRINGHNVPRHNRVFPWKYRRCTVIFAIPGAKGVVKASSNERSWRQPLVSLTTYGDGIKRRDFHRSNDYRSSASKCDEALYTPIASNTFHMDCWVARWVQANRAPRREPTRTRISNIGGEDGYPPRALALREPSLLSAYPYN